MPENDDGNFKESSDDWSYETYTWDEEDGSSTSWQPCKAQFFMPKIGRDPAMFGEYTVTAGMRVYDPTDLTTFQTVASM